MADTLARAGDTSLYQLKVPTQVLNGKGGLVNLEMVLDLVAKMAQQRAIRFIELHAAFLSFGIVGLGKIDGDHPVLVSCQHRRRLVTRPAAEFDGDAVSRGAPGGAGDVRTPGDFHPLHVGSRPFGKMGSCDCDGRTLRSGD